MITNTLFFGKHKHQTPGAEFVLHPGEARFHTIIASVAGVDGRLADARDLRAGGPQLFVLNLGANAIDIIDNAGGAIVSSVAQNKVVQLHLSDNTTQAGTWWHKLQDKLA